MRKPSLDTRRPAALGRMARRANPDDAVVNFTPMIDTARLSRVEIKAMKDGFPYLKDVIQVLMALYGQGRMSPRLKDSIKRWIEVWDEEAETATADGGRGRQRARTKYNMRMRADVYDAALGRWARESRVKTANGMLEFLLECYASGRIQFAMRCGKGAE